MKHNFHRDLFLHSRTLRWTCACVISLFSKCNLDESLEIFELEIYENSLIKNENVESFLRQRGYLSEFLDDPDSCSAPLPSPLVVLADAVHPAAAAPSPLLLSLALELIVYLFGQWLRPFAGPRSEYGSWSIRVRCSCRRGTGAGGQWSQFCREEELDALWKWWSH